MPQASEELRRYWGGIDETPAVEHLKSVGFKLSTKQRWFWIKPHKDYNLTTRDWLALEFLIWEWDWGGLADEEEAA